MRITIKFIPLAFTLFFFAGHALAEEDLNREELNSVLDELIKEISDEGKPEKPGKKAEEPKAEKEMKKAVKEAEEAEGSEKEKIAKPKILKVKKTEEAKKEPEKVMKKTTEKMKSEDAAGKSGGTYNFGSNKKESAGKKEAATGAAAASKAAKADDSSEKKGNWFSNMFRKKEKKKEVAKAKKEEPKKKNGWFGGWFKKDDTKAEENKKKEARKSWFGGGIQSNDKKMVKKDEKSFKATPVKKVASKPVENKDAGPRKNRYVPEDKKAEPKEEKSWFARTFGKKEKKRDSHRVKQEDEGNWFSNMFRGKSKEKAKETKQPTAETLSKAEKGPVYKERAPGKKKSWIGSLFQRNEDRIQAIEEGKHMDNISSSYHFEKVAPPPEHSNTSVPYLAEQTVAVVSKVEGLPVGPFKKQQNITIHHKEGVKTMTGLTIPVYEGDILETGLTPVHLMHRHSAKLTLDRKSKLQLMSILNIDELTLVSGRVRLKVLEKGNPWVIHADRARITAAPGSELVIDRTGDIIVKVSIYNGDVKIASDLDMPAKKYEAGKEVVVTGEGEKITDFTDEIKKLYDDVFKMKEKYDYDQQLQIAIANLNSGNLNWPVKDKVYSNAICSKCSYAFDKDVPAWSHCPMCKTRSH